MRRPCRSSYFAGFFDADGTIGISRRGNSFTLAVRVSQTRKHSGILRQFEAEFGGSVHLSQSNAGREDVLVWTLGPAAAEAFLREVLPWLIVKRERADLALAFRETYPEGELGRATKDRLGVEAYDALLERREDYLQKMARLNRRGRHQPAPLED